MATIGVDLSPLQSAHRMRGIGATAMNVMRNIPKEHRKRHSFVFFLYRNGEKDILDLIEASSFSNYTVRYIEHEPMDYPSVKSREGLLTIPQRVADYFASRRHGTHRISNVEDLDVFLQFEQDIIPPSGVSTAVIAYDLIPYIMESDYLWNYSTARNKHNYSRRGAFKAHMKRSLYLRNIERVMDRATSIIAISEHTKNDFVRILKIKSEKMTICHLGVSDETISTRKKPTDITRYISTLWGDIEKKTVLPATPFLLYVGGADSRRKLSDLVNAYNLLRAQGHKVNLVLAGDTMFGPNSMPNKEAKRSILESSYLDNIYMLGYVSEETRDWLFQNAIAFVYPSRYEGFGLPVLEAMRYGTPVITYEAGSIKEIVGDKAQYANSFRAIAQEAIKLLDNPPSEQVKKDNARYANQFTWSKTAQHIMESTLDE